MTIIIQGLLGVMYISQGYGSGSLPTVVPDNVFSFDFYLEPTRSIDFER